MSLKEDLAQQECDKTFELFITDGQEGWGVYLNNHRIAGPKPWGGGKIIKSWPVSAKDLKTAIGEV